MKVRISRQVFALAAAAALAALLQACGNNSNPASPSPAPTPGEVGATITITADGVNPGSVQIKPGQSVRFVNNDSRTHVPSSDPHPTHTDCPPINAVGTLASGASGTTSAMTAIRSCGFHDHNDPGEDKLRGQIVVAQ